MMLRNVTTVFFVFFFVWVLYAGNANSSDQVVFEEIDENSYANESGSSDEFLKNITSNPVTTKQILDNEIARRRQKELEGDQLYLEGRQSFIGGDYDTAVRKFISAQLKFNSASKSEPRILAKQEQLTKVLAYTYEEWAERISQEALEFSDLSKFEEAIEKYQKVIEKSPSRKKEIDKKISSLQRAITFAEFREKTAPENVDPERPLRDHEVDIKLEQGKVYFNHRRYSDAREMFEQVLLKDPYNLVATRLLKRINEKLLEAGKERREVMNVERIAEIKWKWNDPVTPLVSPDVIVEGTKAVRKISRSSQKIWDKLDTIIIPKLSFEDTAINAVVKYIKTRSQELDPDGEGINIILHLAAAKPLKEEELEEDGEFSEEELDFDDIDFDEFEEELGEESSPAEEEQEVKKTITITMDLDNIPLGEAIRYICQSAGLKFKVETYAIIIASQGVPFDEMETRFYPIEAGFLVQEKTRDSGEGFKNSTKSGGKKKKGKVITDPLELFKSFGVGFPEGAKITYDQRTSKLVVTNSPPNLRKVEKILAELNVQPVQVTIEAKFVEISQKDLDELGFEWLFTGDAQTGGKKNVDFIGNSQFEILKQSGGNASASALTSGIRFLEALDGGGVANDKVLTLNSIIGSWTFNTVIHALQQKESTDVLSAPKVTTISGHTAVLKVIEERFFPTGFTEPELEFSTQTGLGSDVVTPPSVKPSTPEFGAPTELGVILSVTPTVSSDGYSIDLELEPEVVDFIDFDDFSYTITLSGQDFEVPIQQPRISRRKIQTRVIVWDGETVVLGGMITENTRKISDKVPFLGDIPLLGRLFKNEGEISDKRNLLIFVTARLVNPAGLPVRTADIRGLPDFRR